MVYGHRYYSYRPLAHDPYDGSAYYKGWHIEKSDLPTAILKYVTSPIVFAGGYRHENAFLESSFCALDFDSPDTPLKEAIDNIFCDMPHLIATTRSHQKKKDDAPACDRYRVWVPWDKKILDIQTYKYNLQLLVRKYHADRKCKDGARFFFHSGAVVSTASEGVGDMEVKSPTDSWMKRTHAAELDRCRSLNYLTSAAHKILTDAIEPGERNDSYYRGCKDLFRFGYSFQEIQHKVMSSPTYRKASALDQRGYLTTVRSAFNNLATERARLGEQT